MGWNQKEDFASNSKANAALTTGIIGTTLGGLVAANGNGGLLGGLFGNGCNNAAMVAAQAALAAKDAEIGKLKAENYSDRNARDTYDRAMRDSTAVTAAEIRTVNAFVTPIAQGVAKLETKEAAQAVEIAALKKELELKDEIVALRTDKKICEAIAPLALAVQKNADSLVQLQGQMVAGLELEKSERKCADDKIVTYVNTTFQPQLIANPAAGTGTYSAPIFNPLCCTGGRQLVQTPTAAAA